MGYAHTQTGRLLIPVVVFLVVVGGVSLPATFAEDPVAGWLVVLACLAIATLVAAFSRLTVVVDDAGVTASFGLGWPRKRVAFLDVAGATIVRNRWWYGFGIRWVPNGVLWNVWGLDAVELALASGRVVRIGTDEPAELLAALPVHLRR